jgi:hypothetical protein
VTKVVRIADQQQAPDYAYIRNLQEKGVKVVHLAELGHVQKELNALRDPPEPKEDNENHRKPVNSWRKRSLAS